MPPQAESIINRLDEMRQRWWLYSMLCNVILIVAVSLGMISLFVLADALLRLSQTWLTVLLSCWLTATLGIIVVTIYRLLKCQHSLAAAARQAEMSYPELGSDLINLVQLCCSSNGAAESFRLAAINKAVEHASQVPFQSAASRLTRWWRWRLGLQTSRDLIEFTVLLAVLFALIYGSSVAVSTWSSSVDRLFAPWRFVPQVGAVEILEVIPGDDEVLLGAPLKIEARISNPDGQKHDATLHLVPEDGDITTEPMYADDTNDLYAFNLPAVLGPLQYHLQIGDSQSDRYKITVRQKPTIQNVAILYEYPEYLERENEAHQQQHADLEAPQWSVAHLTVTCSAQLDHGYALLPNSRINGEVDATDPKNLLLQIPMTEQASYTIHLFDDAGHTDDQPRTNSLLVIPDALPTAAVVKPSRQSTSAPGKEVPILMRASDDHGLGRVSLEMKLATAEGAGAVGAEVVRTWDRLGGATATTRKHTLTLDPARFQPGQTVLIRVVAADRRQYRGEGLQLDPQIAASPWHEIQLVQPELAAAAQLDRLDSLNQKLWAILQLQIRGRAASISALRADSLAAAVALIRQIERQQTQIQTDTVTLSRSVNPDDSELHSTVKQALTKLAHGEMLRAVQQAGTAARVATIQAVPQQVEPLAGIQDRIIEILQRLLRQTRQEISETLTEMEERPGGDLPDDVAEKLRELKEKLQEFVKQQKRVIEATKSLAKKPVEDFTLEDEQLLQELAAVQDEWSRFLEEMHSDFSKLPEQDFANASLLEELVEVQTEIEMAEDALTKKTADIAVPLEQLGAEMAEELVTNLEKWLPDTPDRERWSQEESLTDEGKEAPMAELPGELEDLIGELMEEEEDLFDEMEDVSSSAADSLDKGAGWDAKDGPISNMSAKGVTGNRLPNTSEIGGRAGEGRQGKSSGEFVADTAVGKGGRKTPSRLAPDPYVQGEVKDLSKDPTGGATGGGKESGVGAAGLEGPVPNRPQEQLRRMAQRQAELRNRAESIDVQFQVLNYHHTDLQRMIDVMAAVEDDLRGGRYQSALRRREILLDSLGNIKAYLQGEFEIRKDQSSNLPEDIQKKLLGSMQDDSPAGWEELNRIYFESLSNE